MIGESRVRRGRLEESERFVRRTREFGHEKIPVLPDVLELPFDRLETRGELVLPHHRLPFDVVVFRQGEVARPRSA